MRTRSSSNLIVESSTTSKRRNHRRSKQRVEPFSLKETFVVTMVDQRTMAELLQAPTEGYGDAIFIPAILAENFELKHGLLNLVTSKQFYGFEKEDPYAHIYWFNKITSMINGNLLTKTPRDALAIIENKLKVCNSRNKPVVTKVSTKAPSSSTPHFPEIAALADAIKAMLLQKSSPLASVKAVIQNGNSKKRISNGKDGVVRILPPVSAAEIHAVEKERKARIILLMAIPKEHMRRFHGMDDAKEIWEAIRTRFGGNANSKKMQKAVLKQQFEAFTISSSEGLEKGYDRFQQLLSQLEAHGDKVSTEDANHKFLRYLPPAWSNLAMTMKTKPDVDTLSIDDLQTQKVKVGHTGAYNTCTPTSSNNIQEREVPAGFANEVIYSLFAKQSEDLDLLHEDLEQIDDVDIEKMDINWQIAMDAISNEEVIQKELRSESLVMETNCCFGRKKKLECFKCHNTGHFARECPSKGINDGKTRDSFYHRSKELRKKGRNQKMKTLDSWKNSSKNLWKLVDSGMTSNSKVGLGYEIQSNKEVLSYEEEMNRTVFKCIKEDFLNKPLYSRFSKTDNFKGVPHPLTRDYTPKPQEEIDDSLINRANHFVPRPVQLNAVKANVNTGRANINTVRANVNSGRTNVNSVRPRVYTVSSNVNTVRSRQQDHPLKNMGDRGEIWFEVYLPKVFKMIISSERDVYEKKKLNPVQRFSSDNNVADLLTKAFNGPSVKLFGLRLVVYDVYRISGAAFAVALPPVFCA
ncbi:ribonuclease H-like domain-containing protein [Tanacetum coccineum]